MLQATDDVDEAEKRQTQQTDRPSSYVQSEQQNHTLV